MHYFHIQTSLKVDVAAFDIHHLNPCIIAKEDKGVEKDTETFLVAEKTVICKIPGHQALLTLLAAYYAFNMAYAIYPKGLTCLHVLLEKVLLNRHTSKESQLVATLFTSLSHFH